MANSGGIQETCFWFGFRDGTSGTEALRGEHETDIAIIGGGFTGLWTAHFIKQKDPSVRVTVIESERIGYGASGRNGGEACPTIDQTDRSAIDHFGIDDARKMARIAEVNFAAFKAFASDCDFEDTGWLHAALSEDHMEIYRDTWRAVQDVGSSDTWEFLNAEEMRRELNSPLYIGGTRSRLGGVVNPMKVVMKLLRTVQDQGVQIFEHTRAVSVQNGEIRTHNGHIRAKRVILATDAFGHLLEPSLARSYVPLYDYILVSAPLTDQQRARIGWSSRSAVADARAFFNYYRLTHDNRILWGSSDAVYYAKNSVGPQHDTSPEHRAVLERAFRTHFPQLHDVQFEYAWGGPIAATTRLSPCFGSRQAGTLLYGLGYTGQGVVCSRFAGDVLSDMALARTSELLTLKMVTTSPIPYPPEPLRHFIISIVRRALERTDAGHPPNLLLRFLRLFNIEFSS